MNKPQRKRLYREAIRKWGLSLQLGMLMEECAELIQATHKVVRNGNKDTNNVFLSSIAWRNFAKEIADVEIMIEQVKTAIDWQNLDVMVETNKHDKLLRLKDMLEKTP